MNPVLLDTNIIIYAANNSVEYDHLRELLGVHIDLGVSIITHVESLGFPNIDAMEEGVIKGLLATITAFEVNNDIVDKAVVLKKMKRMSLGDAFIAATALVHGCELWTNNTDDFKHIPGLKLYNPFEA